MAALLLGGAVAAGEVRAQDACSSVNTATHAPYICHVARQAPSSSVQQNTQTLTWRVTFSEPVVGFNWDDFWIDDETKRYDGQPEDPEHPYGQRRYGTGSSDIQTTRGGGGKYWDVQFTWDCTSANNDCQHNEADGGTVRYQGRVTLELPDMSSEGTWRRASPTTGTGTSSRSNVLPASHFTVN